MHGTTPSAAHNPDAARDYDASYYAHSLGAEPCHPESPVWRAFFGAVAEAIVGEIQPRTALDAGCGIGMLVEELRRRDVDARGFDFSPYAISQVPEPLRPYCRVGSILDPLPADYDLVTCIEVLEHLAAELADAAIANLVGHTDAVLFSSTPDDFREPTHLNVQPTAFWVGLFARHGFYRDHSFDANVVSPHALLLRRRSGSVVATIREYEAHQARAMVEIRELRAAHLSATREREDLRAELVRVREAQANSRPEWELPAEAETPAWRPPANAEAPAWRPPIDTSDPAWRLFVAATGARRRLAPDETARGRLVRAAALGLADGMDWAYTRLAWLRGHPALSAGDESTSPLAGAAETQRAGATPMPAQDPSATVVSEPLGIIDGPPPGSVWHRLVPVWGWAIDRASASGPGIQTVRVFMDGILKGTAMHGSPRYDVEERYGAPFLRAGWRFGVDLQGVSRGSHRVEVKALSTVSGEEATYSHTISVEPLPPPAWKKLVLFISDCPGDSFRYRCEHQAEQVRCMGGTADVTVREAVDLGAALERYHLFVLHRVIFTVEVEWFLDQARSRGLPVLYDLDDFVFDVGAAPLLTATLERFTERQIANVLDGFAWTRDALVRADSVQVSSEPLRELVNKVLGYAGARVVSNVVSEDMLHQASAAQWLLANEPPAPVTIAYLSGTATHDRDFLSAADGLIWALDQYPNVRLVTVGPLALDDRFARFGDRVEQLPLRPWQELPALLASVAINIAPLEPNNAFTESKSSIKYLEAALVGVPTIASPTSDFKRVITHGVSGYLADTPDEWRDALASLIESADLRRQVGQRAQADVLRNHTTAAAASSFCAALAEIVPKPDPREPLIINWVVQSVGPGRDGPHAKMFELADSLRARGHQVRVCLVPEPAVDDRHTLPPADITVATDWSTAHVVAHQSASTFRAYFALDDAATLPQPAPEKSAALPVRFIGYGQAVAGQLAGLTGRPAAHVIRTENPQDDAANLERVLLNMTFARLR